MFGPVSEGMRMFRSRAHVAVVGYSDRNDRVVSKIAKYLVSEGNQVTGVNPRLAGTNDGPIEVHASLADLGPGIDIIQIFRNSSVLPELACEILALKWRPKMVWCQQGVVDVLFQQKLESAGIPVVMDACPYALRSYL